MFRLTHTKRVLKQQGGEQTIIILGDTCFVRAHESEASIRKAVGGEFPLSTGLKGE